jgi:hypothetical protein
LQAAHLEEAVADAFSCTRAGGSVVNEDSAIEELRPSAPGSAKRRAEFREMGGSFPAKKPMRKPVSKFTLKLRGLREE